MSRIESEKAQNKSKGGRLMKFDRRLTGLDLRGANYKIVLDQVTTSLGELFDIERKMTGKVTMRAIILISEELGLPVKTTCEFLECLGKLPVGTWERSRIKSNQINEVKEMAWKNGMGLVTANKLFERYGVLIAQDPNTKIYTATLGDRTIQHTSVTAIAETILDKWFTIFVIDGNCENPITRDTAENAEIAWVVAKDHDRHEQTKILGGSKCWNQSKINR